MNWNCAQTEERLSDFLDSLMAPEEAAAFSAHAESCADCSRLLRQVGGIVQRMQTLEPVQEPHSLVRKILDATLGAREQKQGWRRWFDWSPSLLTPRLAMGAVTVAILLVIVFAAVGVTPGKIKRADLSPTNLARSANRQAHLAYARSAKFVNDLRVVYEIQSALQRTQDQSPSVAPEQPQSRPESAPPSNPQEKSQTEPRPRSQLKSGTMLAWILAPSAAGFPRSAR